MKVDYNRDKILSDQAKELLEGYYQLSNESSPQDAFVRAASAYSYGDKELAQRIYDYASNGWFMFASPVLSNAPDIEWPEFNNLEEASEWLKNEWKPMNKLRGLSISCYVTYTPDSVKGLVSHSEEVRWLSVHGGGVGGYWGDVRSLASSVGSNKGRPPGIMPFLHTVDSDMVAYSQSGTRRGNYAAYLDVSHPELIEFLEMRIPSGDINRKNLNLHHGLNITDDFIEAVRTNSDWDLVDPHTKDVVETFKARDIWERVIEIRNRTGEPYIVNKDEANRRLPDSQKAKGLKFNSSNLCSEIFLPTAEDRTAVCCLSSVNLEKYDEWKDTNMVNDLIRLLDNVLQFFIDCAHDELERSRYSAMQERSLGLGAMGFHSYLQSKMIPFESAMAKSTNIRIFKSIKEQAVQASQELAVERGEPNDMKGTGMRNAHLMAIAPNSNNSIILGTSPSIEPWRSPAFTQGTRAGSFLVQNKYLGKLLETKYDEIQPKEDKEKWLKAQWKTVITDGSVDNLEYLSDYERDVFKPADDIDQHWVVEHAKDRQKYVCQGQSVNLFFPYGTDKSYVASVHWSAFQPNEEGVSLKGLYYLRTESAGKGENVSKKVVRNVLKDGDCIACES